MGPSGGGIARHLTNTVVDGIALDEAGRSSEFKIFSCARPWFRAFHFSWLSFFVAFTGWFAMAPALEYLIRDTTNDITFGVAKTSNIISVLATIFVRFSLGPVCEKYGARKPQTILLCGGAMLVLASALIRSSTSLYILRFFIGLVGGCFVPCQYWTSMMFSKRVVGSANAFAGGWGNLGGGFALIFVGSIINAFIAGGVDESYAWRYAMVFPAMLMVLVAVPLFFLTDDCPQGLWKDRVYNDPEQKKLQALEAEQNTNCDQTGGNDTKVKVAPKSKSVIFDWRVWLLAMLYAGSFGVELAINNSMSSYLFRYFNTDDETCAPQRATSTYPDSCSTLGLTTSTLIASLFGLMNIFARAIGGVTSDFLFSKIGMRGRIFTLFFCLVGQGIALMVFSQITSVPAAIVILVIFSIFVQSSEGATFAVVPFINTSNIGMVAGIVGAGGNIGAVSWSTMFKQISNQSDAYLYLGGIILFLGFFVTILPVQGVYMLGCDHQATLPEISDTGSEGSEAVDGEAFYLEEGEVDENEEGEKEMKEIGVEIAAV